jgi:hypothetical protein
MRRREFITLLGDSAVAWSLAARAQAAGSERLIGILMPYAESDPFGRSLVEAFRAALGKLGWMEGSNPLASNSLATSTARLRVYETAIVSRLLFSRKIRGAATKLSTPLWGDSHCW